MVYKYKVIEVVADDGNIGVKVEFVDYSKAIDDKNPKTKYYYFRNPDDVTPEVIREHVAKEVAAIEKANAKKQQLDSLVGVEKDV